MSPGYTRLILGRKVKGQGHRVTKCKDISQAIEWPAWVCTCVECPHLVMTFRCLYSCADTIVFVWKICSCSCVYVHVCCDRPGSSRLPSSMINWLWWQSRPLDWRCISVKTRRIFHCITVLSRCMISSASLRIPERFLSFIFCQFVHRSTVCVRVCVCVWVCVCQNSVPLFFYNGFLVSWQQLWATFKR